MCLLDSAEFEEAVEHNVYPCGRLYDNIILNNFPHKEELMMHETIIK